MRVRRAFCRVVLDTNILVRAFINLNSDSGRILKACEHRRVVPVLSKAVLDEYRFVLRDSKLLVRFPQLSEPTIAVALERLRYIGDMYRRVRTRFAYPRDPKDSHLIELAIAGGATHLISTDDDLLALNRGQDEAAKRFRQRLPNAEVVKPEEFVRRYGTVLGPNRIAPEW